jgi:hypothetical protein
MLRREKHPHDADDKPGRQRPPGNLEGGVGRVFERRPRQNQRVIGNDASMQQHDGRDAEKGNPGQRSAQRMAPEKEMGRQSQEGKRTETNRGSRSAVISADERSIVASCL